MKTGACLHAPGFSRTGISAKPADRNLLDFDNPNLPAMKIKFTIQILLWGISLTAMTAPETLARHDQRILDREISIDVQNVPLAAALTEIEIAADVKFVYSGSQLDLDQPVTIAVRQKRLGLILNDLLGPIGIMYTVDREYILLKPVKAEIAKPVLTGEAGAAAEPFQAISGTVTDAATLQPIAGVNIIVKGTTSGTTTDSEGKYVIDAEEGDMLVFSFIGYRKMEVPVGGRMIIDVSLEEDVASLKEVVVNAGYYTVTDKTKTGNISKVTAKEIERQPVTSPLMALQGRVAGLEITPVSGAPGGAPVITIRGKNSLRTTGNYPLYIIDGVPVQSNHLQTRSGSIMAGGFDPLISIDPANIESIEVLKDADATAIYGSRGANGVILITTRGASKANGTDVDVNIYHGIGQVPGRMDLLDTRQYLEMRREAFANDEQQPSFTQWDLVYWDTTRHTNWQEVFLGNTANITDAQASISATSGNTSFRFGGGFHKESLVLPGDLGYQRANVHLNVNHTSDNNRFRAAMSANYGLARNDVFDDGYLVASALTLPPVAPALHNDDGTLNWELFDFNGSMFGTWQNPLTSLLKTHEANNATLILNSNLAYQISGDLTLTANIGLNDLNGDEFIRNPVSYHSPQNRPYFTGGAFFGANRRKSWIAEPQVNYSKELGDHEINAIIGTTWQVSEYEYQMVSGSGYVSDALLNSLRGANQISFLSDDYAEYKYNAFYSRIGYAFKDKYLLNLTGRRDGSSRFGDDKKFGNFGALGLAWIFSNEGFISNSLSFLNFGKIRASYGSTGNDQIPDYAYYKAYNLVPNQYQNSINLLPAGLSNPDFGWESTHKLETAIELGLFQDRIGLALSWYRNRSSNQLVQYQLPATTGFSSILSNFDATVENSGLEVLFNAVSIKSADVTWSTSLNISFPENRLVRFDGIEESPYAKIYKVGEPLSIRRLYRWAGVNPETGVHEFVDVDEDGFINDNDKVFMKPLQRHYYGGLNNQIIYKRMQLSFLIQFSDQNGTRYMPSKPGGNTNQPVAVMDRWQRPGDQTEVQRFNQSTALSTAYFNLGSSDYNEEDASFIRLKTVSLAYDLPGSVKHKLRMEQAQVYLQCQNLVTFTNSLQLDPETGSALPPLRMVSLGLQLRY